MLPLLFLLLSLCDAIDVGGCGVTKECLFSPPGCSLPNCSYFLSYHGGDEWTVFEMASAGTGEKTNYLAVGMSTDEAMGEEPVSFCFFPPPGEPPVVGVGYNNGKSNEVAPEALDATVHANVEMLHAERDGDTLFCSFRQRIKPTKVHEMLPSLAKSFTLLMARGHAPSASRLGIHSLDSSTPDFPFIAPAALNLSHAFALQNDTTTTLPPVPAPITPSPWFDTSTRRFLIKIHGILMILPWLCLVPTAVVAARYLREEWSYSTPGGLHWWFLVHRAINWSCVPLLFLSTLLVFVAKEFSWKGPAYWKNVQQNLRPSSLHTLFGTVAILGAVVQVISSLIRPSLHSRARPVFNFIHRTMGILSVVTAVVAIFFAVNYFHVWEHGTRALLVFLVSFFLLVGVVIAFEVLSRTRSGERKEEIELSPTGGRAVPSTHQGVLAKRLLFFAFAVISVCLSVYLCTLMFI